MEFNKWKIFSEAVVLALSGLAVVYTLGVVWRVEKKLDVAYKFFLAAILFFILSEIAPLANPFQDFWLGLFAEGAKMMFAIFFLAGVWTMRSMIRKMDGEK